MSGSVLSQILEATEKQNGIFATNDTIGDLELTQLAEMRKC